METLRRFLRGGRLEIPLDYKLAAVGLTGR